MLKKILRTHVLIVLLLSLTSILTSNVLMAEGRGIGRNTLPDHTTAFSSGKYRAIIIGNDLYKDPKNIWRPLSTAVRDAESIAKILKESYAFTDIQLIRNAKRRDILQAMSNLRKNTQKNDSVLIYYAGHGWQNENTNEAYWVPVDAEGNDDSTFVSNARIREKLAVIADIANHTLLISDSCFSGTLLSADRGANFNFGQDQEAYYRKIAKRKSVQILAAGGKEFVDDNYRSSGHSPFTYFLIKELEDNNNKYLTFSNLAINVEQLVARNVDQTPQSGALRKAGDEGGQFIFKRGSGKDNVRDSQTSGSTRSIRKNRIREEEAEDELEVLPMPSF